MFSFSSGVMLYISYMDILRHSEMDLGDNGYFYSKIGVKKRKSIVFFGNAFFLSDNGPYSRE